jgi:hypothetical protein
VNNSKKLTNTITSSEVIISPSMFIASSLILIEIEEAAHGSELNVGQLHVGEPSRQFLDAQRHAVGLGQQRTGGSRDHVTASSSTAS